MTGSFNCFAHSIQDGRMDPGQDWTQLRFQLAGVERMPLAMRHRDEDAPVRERLPGLEFVRVDDAVRMADLQGREEAEIARRFAQGHRAYAALLDSVPAAWGWVATREAVIGELGADFRISTGDRYLWNFVTLPAFRGRGIYPLLLEFIVAAESVEAERFWIAWAPENHASAAGIRKGGFTPVAELSFDAAGRAAVSDLVSGGGALAARMLNLPQASGTLTPCWRCVRAGRGVHYCPSGSCRCDYQRAAEPCHADAPATTEA